VGVVCAISNAIPAPGLKRGWIMPEQSKTDLTLAFGHGARGHSNLRIARAHQRKEVNDRKTGAIA
jgi:hypothetical protein